MVSPPAKSFSTTAVSAQQQINEFEPETATPGDADVQEAVRQLQEEHPDHGWRRLLPKLKAQHPDWRISESRFKQILRSCKPA